MTEDKGFVIKDKRFSSTEGAGQEQASGEKEQREAPAGEKVEKKSGARSGQALPQVNFPTFIVSLSTSVLVYLGEIDDPATGQKAANLPVAKQTIDILAMLEEKTKGNLSEDEARMLQNILYDLRIRYVALAKK